MENQNLIKRGSIFYYDLGATDGSVQSGTRPVRRKDLSLKKTITI